VASGYVVLTGAAVPALGTYKTELFPTRSRARVGALFDVVGVAGSATGLVAVGYLSERWDDLGSAIGVMVFAPLLVAVVIIARFPETAARELEAFNPGDPALDPVGGPPPPSPTPAGTLPAASPHPLL
jgi:MFS family permease